MDLIDVVFQTNTHYINIKKISSTDWFFQVLTGAANTTHVETKEFGTYKEAVDYAFETYGLVTE